MMYVQVTMLSCPVRLACTALFFLFCFFINQVIKLQAAIKYSEEDVPAARV
jgi:hypothetical protein